MKLIHICANATRSKESIRIHRLNISVINKKHSGLLKSNARRASACVTANETRMSGTLQAAAGVVEPSGIEPMTFWMQTRRSPS